MKLTLSFETPTKGGAARWLIREEGLPDVLAEIMPGPRASELAALFRTAPDMLEDLKNAVWHWDISGDEKGDTEKDDLACAKRTIRKATEAAP